MDSCDDTEFAADSLSYSELGSQGPNHAGQRLSGCLPRRAGPGPGRLPGRRWSLSESEPCSDFHHWSYGVTVSAVMAAAAAARPLGLPVGMLVPEPALHDYF